MAPDTRPTLLSACLRRSISFQVQLLAAGPILVPLHEY